MQRMAMQKLLAWRDSANRKPLIVRGARQVGKTWLMQEFGRMSFQKTVYVNFESHREIAALFDGNLEISRLMAGLQIFGRSKITPQDTLIVFDEVQEAPRALASLNRNF